jgi:hypothetical protein
MHLYQTVAKLNRFGISCLWHKHPFRFANVFEFNASWKHKNTLSYLKHSGDLLLLLPIL